MPQPTSQPHDDAALLCIMEENVCPRGRPFDVDIGLRSLPLGGWLQGEGTHRVYAHPMGDGTWAAIPGLIATWIENQLTRPDGTPVIKAVDIREVT